MPASRSYAPADPHSTPPAKGSRCSTASRTSAASARTETRTRAATARIRTVEVFIASPFTLRPAGRSLPAPADDDDEERNHCGDQDERERQQDERDDGVHFTSRVGRLSRTCEAYAS